ncbi:hypothetical protein FOE78_08075 [Microlunatus elymi]|uniref:SdpI/YhfL protein family protein n=1 Tax=Microlunatus elymi TaxID=2596828 RepID=A0A516PXF3_9ACTN|nr:hypothetical protein [Microlunatus elymi]QDP95860.1 hypothetical protein FOE78_08075 [Microlunatus elymi]
MTIGVFVLLQVLVPRSRRQTGINIPNKSYWVEPKNLPRARRMLSADFALLGCLFQAFFCCLPPALVSASAAPGHPLPGWFVVALVLWPATIVALSAWTVAVRYRVSAS